MLPTPRVLPQTPRMQAGVRPAGRPAPASACVPADRDAARLGAAAGRLVRPQQDVFGEGEAVRGVLILRRGWAFRYRLLADGRRQIIHFLMAGDPIVLADGVARHSVAALTDAEVVRLPRPEIEGRLAALGRELEARSVREQDAIIEHTISLGRRTAKERMLCLLLEICRRSHADAPAEDGPAGFDFPATQPVLADALGLSTVHVNRTLQMLRQEGLADLQAGRVHIASLEDARDEAAAE